MEGYIINSSNMWTHALKRQVRPGGKISLNELYEQYGLKHSIPEGEEFIRWLTTVKLKDKGNWEVVLDEIPDEEIEQSLHKETGVVPKIQDKDDVVMVGKGSNIKPIVVNKLDVLQVVDMPVRTAKEVIPKVKDLRLLKYALKEANTRAHRDVLCNILRKRIKELELTRYNT